MSNIDKRSDSVSRIIADLKLKHGSGDTYAPIMRWDEILALLDELAFLDKRNAELNSTLERWAADRAQSASELEEKDAQIANLTAERDALREGEMGDAKHSNTRAAADIYFQLVEECGIPAGGSLVEYVSELRERAAMLQGADRNSPVIPDGWKLVPVEPTPEMQSAAAGAIRFDTTPINKLWTGNAVYKAMLAAAPQQEVK
ncbi:hypothetical protein ACFVFU_000831 [Enterobacter hormaechei]